jgi:hypothetical protein
MIEKDLDERVRTLADELHGALNVLGASARPGEVAKRFEELDQAARDAGVGALSAAVGRDEILADLRRADLDTLAELTELDPDALACDGRLRLASSEEARQILSLGAFVTWATQMMDEIEASLEQRSGGDRAVSRVDAAQKDLLDVLRRVEHELGEE